MAVQARLERAKAQLPVGLAETCAILRLGSTIICYESSVISSCSWLPIPKCHHRPVLSSISQSKGMESRPLSVQHNDNNVEECGMPGTKQITRDSAKHQCRLCLRSHRGWQLEEEEMGANMVNQLSDEVVHCSLVMASQRWPLKDNDVKSM